MAYKVNQSDASERDLNGILDYLSETLAAPQAARNFYNKLMDCFDKLQDFPFLFPLCRIQKYAAKGIRCAVVKNYIVFYKVDEKNKIIKIHRIVHGSMDLTKSSLDFLRN